MGEYVALIAVLVLWIAGMIAMHIAIRLLNRKERREVQEAFTAYDVLAEARRVASGHWQRCQEDRREC